MLTSVLLCLASQAGAGANAPKLPDAKAAPLFEVELQLPDRVATAWARSAPLPAVAKRLEQALHVPVRLASALAATRVSFRAVQDVPLTDLLARLAPAVHLDSREIWGKNAELRAIHLVEAGTAMPAPEAAGIVIAGHTSNAGDSAAVETGSDLEWPAPPKEGPFLRVRRLADGRLDLDAREQGLGVLLFEVAQAYGARFDLRIPEAPIVERLTVNGIWPSQLPAHLGLPGIGIDVRRNVATAEEVVLRYFVDPAP